MSLLSLPDELLIKIVLSMRDIEHKEYADEPRAVFEPETVVKTSREAFTLWSPLSQTNRRLRTIVFPLVARDVHILEEGTCFSLLKKLDAQN